MGARVHAFRDDALGDDDAVAIAARLRAREISVEEAVGAAIERAELVDPHLHAVRWQAYERALSRAGCWLDARPFSGVPMFIKDNLQTAGFPTTYGSRAFTPQVAKRDVAPVAQLKDQGFVVIGKSTTPELALSISTEFAELESTRNPWNTDYSTGGSSGGSAALVAAGVVPVGHANDGAGSIRIPAGANGLVGLKPSHARLLDQPGANLLPSRIAVEGFVTRSVRDTAHLLAAMERFRPNPKLRPVGLVRGSSGRRMRIGLVTGTLSGAPVDPESLAAVQATAETLVRLGHSVAEMGCPVDRRFVDDFRDYWAFFAAGLVADSKALHPRSFRIGMLEPYSKSVALAGVKQIHRWPGIFGRLRQVPKLYDANFEGFDAMLTPLLNHPPSPIGHFNPAVPFEQFFERVMAYVGFTPLQNAAGAPAIALPCGMTASGLPNSIQLAARRGDEKTLLELAYELEEAQSFPRINQ